MSNLEFQVHTSALGLKTYPSVSSLKDGGFVVTWQSDGPNGWIMDPGYGIFGQRYDSSGVAAGNEFQINTGGDGFENRSAVASLSDGGFVVTWLSNNYGIFGQRYDSLTKLSPRQARGFR